MVGSCTRIWNGGSSLAAVMADSCKGATAAIIPIGNLGAEVVATSCTRICVHAPSLATQSSKSLRPRKAPNKGLLTRLGAVLQENRTPQPTKARPMHRDTPRRQLVLGLVRHRDWCAAGQLVQDLENKGRAPWELMQRKARELTGACLEVSETDAELCAPSKGASARALERDPPRPLLPALQPSKANVSRTLGIVPVDRHQVTLRCEWRQLDIFSVALLSEKKRLRRSLEARIGRTCAREAPASPQGPTTAIPELSRQLAATTEDQCGPPPTGPPAGASRRGTGMRCCRPHPSLCGHLPQQWFSSARRATRTRCLATVRL
eukprot:scaffold52728_cov69-Phaeocystis_antarctica.AAC.3